MPSARGDSGGPVVVYDRSTGLVGAEGIISAELYFPDTTTLDSYSMFYTFVPNIEPELNVTISVGVGG